MAGVHLTMSGSALGDVFQSGSLRKVMERHVSPYSLVTVPIQGLVFGSLGKGSDCCTVALVHPLYLFPLAFRPVLLSAPLRCDGCSVCSPVHVRPLCGVQLDALPFFFCAGGQC